MAIRIEFETDNEAFQGADYYPEVSRILLKLAREMEEGRLAGPIMDVNGNKIGQFTTD